MKKIHFLLYIAILTSSCTSTLFTSIDVLRPAKVSFDKTAKNLLILNNTAVQPASYGHTNNLLGEKKKNISVNTDSLAFFCLSVVNEEFQKREFFDNTYLQLLSTNNSVNFLTSRPPLADTLHALASKYRVDAILSLDKLKVNDQLAEDYDEGSGAFYAILEANYESTWTVSYPQLNKSTSFNFKDTIYWDSESFQRKKNLESLPDRYNALIDGALYVGQATIKKLIPWWDKEDRYFFRTNNKYMKIGLDSVYTKNWESAISTWEEGVKTAKNTQKAKLQHNIAIAYEIIGNMEKAKEFSNLSLTTYLNNSMLSYDNFNIINQYQALLKKRIEEINEINKQLGLE